MGIEMGKKGGCGAREEEDDIDSDWSLTEDAAAGLGLAWEQQLGNGLLKSPEKKKLRKLYVYSGNFRVEVQVAPVFFLNLHTKLLNSLEVKKNLSDALYILSWGWKDETWNDTEVQTKQNLKDFYHSAWNW